MKQTILIIMLFIWIAHILFLSFQTGSDTANTSIILTKYILDLFIDGEVPTETLLYWHKWIRLLAHPVSFMLYQILAILTMKQFAKRNWIIYGIPFVTGMILAIGTEVGKRMIPGRHCDVSEMMLNIAGLLVGVILMFCFEKMVMVFRSGKDLL